MRQLQSKRFAFYSCSVYRLHDTFERWWSF